MIIKDMEITNFGKFSGKRISFEKGINIIYGENEAGKSTIHTFIRGMLFGIEKQRGRAGANDTYTKYQPWDNPSSYGGIMRVEKDGLTYRIERSFEKNSKSLRIIRENDGYELSDPGISKLFDGLNESGYYNTVSIGQLAGATDKGLEEVLKNYAANLGSTRSTELNMKTAVDDLKSRRKKIVSGSGLDKKRELLRERDRLNEELLISEKEQEKLNEKAKDCRGQLKELSGEKERLLLAAEEQKAKAISSQAKKENLLSKKEEISAQIDSLEKSRQELEENLENLKKTAGDTSGTSADEIEDKIKTARKESKFTVATFVLAVICVAAAFACYFGLFGLDSYLIMYFVEAAIALDVLCVISIIIKAAGRKKKIAALTKLQGDIVTMAALEEEISARDGKITEKRNEDESVEAAARDIDREIAGMPDYEKQIADLDGRANGLNIEIERLGWDLEHMKNEDAEKGLRLEEIGAALDEMSAAETEIEAIETAINRIEEIGREVSGTFGIELNEKASEHIAAITGGKYDSICIDDKMNININRSDRLIGLNRMSCGTIEQIYLSLRLAAAEILFENDSKPLLFDDAFAMYDNKRLMNTLRYIEKASEQAILFSCHTREKVLADKAGVKYNLIRL